MQALTDEKIPCILFEDRHLLAVNKPPGINTHSPSPFAGEGIYDWLRDREPRWATLAIIQRLDKETSGVLLFSKTVLGNRELTLQFTQRRVRKSYVLLSDRQPEKSSWTAKSSLIRVADRYASQGTVARGHYAETRFQVVGEQRGFFEIEAEPVTGRTHQIRVHASESGVPILGDVLYGGTPSHRVCLHALALEVFHPKTGEPMRFTAPVDFFADPVWLRRSALLDEAMTDSWRVVQGAADGHPGWYVERWGDWVLSQSEQAREAMPPGLMEHVPVASRGHYHKKLVRHLRGKTPAETSPELVSGAESDGPILIRENGLRYQIRFDEGYSVGLFLDQRDNRRRAAIDYVAPGFGPISGGKKRGWEVLNTFAYTCGFSVCAAKLGGHVTSVDLSKRYLQWGRENFDANALDSDLHEFIYGDVFDWLNRFHKKGRQFQFVLLDPPTFSQSKESGGFRAEKDYRRLTAAALKVLRPGGVLFASSNAYGFKTEQFLAAVKGAVADAGRQVDAEHYVPQPPDFAVHRNEPAYLKTLWLRVN